MDEGCTYKKHQREETLACFKYKKIQPMKTEPYGEDCWCLTADRGNTLAASVFPTSYDLTLRGEVSRYLSLTFN